MNFLDYEQPLHPGAQRFEGGTGNYPGIVALGVSLALLTRAGFANIEEHVRWLTGRLIEGVRRAGIGVVSDTRPDHRSGIVVLDRGGRDVGTLIQQFDSANVGVTVRDVGVRVSPHGYNNETDIDRVLDVLASRALNH